MLHNARGYLLVRQFTARHGFFQCIDVIFRLLVLCIFPVQNVKSVYRSLLFDFLNVHHYTLILRLIRALLYCFGDSVFHIVILHISHSQIIPSVNDTRFVFQLIHILPVQMSKYCIGILIFFKRYPTEDGPTPIFIAFVLYFRNGLCPWGAEQIITLFIFPHYDIKLSFKSFRNGRESA